MFKDKKNIERIIDAAIKEGEMFNSLEVGGRRIGGYMDAIRRQVEYAFEFLKEIKNVDEKIAMKEHGIVWATVFRERKWYARLITSYEKVIMLLAYHLKSRGVPLHEIKYIIEILKQY